MQTQVLKQTDQTIETALSFFTVTSVQFLVVKSAALLITVIVHAGT